MRIAADLAGQPSNVSRLIMFLTSPASLVRPPCEVGPALMVDRRSPDASTPIRLGLIRRLIGSFDEQWLEPSEETQ
jgi:hypothetical protein